MQVEIWTRRIEMILHHYYLLKFDQITFELKFVGKCKYEETVKEAVGLQFLVQTFEATNVYLLAARRVHLSIDMRIQLKKQQSLKNKARRRLKCGWWVINIKEFIFFKPQNFPFTLNCLQLHGFQPMTLIHFFPTNFNINSKSSILKHMIVISKANFLHSRRLSSYLYIHSSYKLQNVSFVFSKAHYNLYSYTS